MRSVPTFACAVLFIYDNIFGRTHLRRKENFESAPEICCRLGRKRRASFSDCGAPQVFR